MTRKEPDKIEEGMPCQAIALGLSVDNEIMVIGRTDAVVGWHKIRRERREQGRREGMTLAKDKCGDRPEKVKSGGKRGL